ncbi:MAG: HAD family phosphatase [Synechococcales bacterium]|nr:HAD family phosphatase [Synechococcales bacterium]
MKAILFDLDGTLANTDPLHFATWQDVLKDYRLDIDRAFYDANFSGRLNVDIIRDILPHLSLEEGRQLGDRKEAEFRCRAATQLSPLPGLLNLLDWTDANKMQRAIVTNAPPDNAWFMLDTLRLRSTFPVVVIAEELPFGKPHPLPYQVGLEKLGVAPEEALVFEDSPSGIRSAVGAGITTIGVASTHSSEDLYAAGATWVIRDFTEIQTFSSLVEKSYG